MFLPFILIIGGLIGMLYSSYRMYCIAIVRKVESLPSDKLDTPNPVANISTPQK